MRPPVIGSGRDKREYSDVKSSIKPKEMTREEFQTERTRIISEMLDNPDEYGIYPTTKCFEQLDALFDSLSLPPAEGAEEIEAELRGYARDIVRLHKPIMEVNPQLAMDSIGNDLVKMFNRLAQRIAEKMVSERLREGGK